MPLTGLAQSPQETSSSSSPSTPATGQRGFTVRESYISDLRFDNCILGQPRFIDTCIAFTTFTGTAFTNGDLIRTVVIYSSFNSGSDLSNVNVKDSLFLMCTYNGEPLTLERLQQLGARNVDSAITDLYSLQKKLEQNAISKSLAKHYCQMVSNILTKLKTNISILPYRRPIAILTPVEALLKKYIVKPIPILSLKNLAAKVAAENKSDLFQKLSTLPDDLAATFPNLDVNYKRIFIRKVTTGVLDDISFTPTNAEERYLNEIRMALQADNPYNAIHAIMCKIGVLCNKGFFSDFKSHMEPIRTKIIGLMREYNQNKTEYTAMMAIRR